MHLSPQFIVQAAISLLSSAAIVQGLVLDHLDRRATVCNGHAELCDRSYGNVTVVGAHDSYAVGVNNRAQPQLSTANLLMK